MNYDPKRHHRRSIRLKDYDYSQKGLYFISLCCQDRIHLFGKIRHQKMNLNSFGKIAHKEWLNSLNIRDNIDLHDFIVMPNHFHAIIEILFKKGDNEKHLGKFRSPSHTIGAIIRGYKIATTKQIREEISSYLNSKDSAKKKKEAKEKGKGAKNRAGIAGIAGIVRANCNSPQPSGDSPQPSDDSPQSSDDSPQPSGDSLRRRWEGTETFPLSDSELIKISKAKRIWQRNYYEHIIRNKKAYNNIANYIRDNPKRWKEDTFNRKK